MDILLIFYSILLTGIFVAPFLYIRFNHSILISHDGELRSTLDSERKMLLENLKDLKTEMDTGKIKSVEFSDLSQDIISSLKQLDAQILGLKDKTTVLKKQGLCPKCNFQTTITGAKFCAKCGNPL